MTDLFNLDYADRVGVYQQVRRTSPAVLSALTHALQPHAEETGIDLGCGTGNYTVPFVDSLASVVGVDRSLAMLSLARARSSRISWKVADLRRLSFEAESFDKAWAVLAMHHLRHHQREVFRRVFELLRLGGRFVVFTQFAEQLATLWLCNYFPSLSKDWEAKYQRSETLREWLTEAGFGTVSSSLFFVQDSRDSFIRVGQRSPELYLDSRIFLANPVGRGLPRAELKQGLIRLHDDIRSQRVQSVMRQYQGAGEMPGEYAVLTATKT